MSEKTLVAGAGGFVGGFLVDHLRKFGHDVRAVSSRPVEDWLRSYSDVESISLDLRDPRNCERAMKGVKWVYNLAAKVGGIGYIGEHRVDCLLSSLINTNLLRAATDVAGYLYVSSACVYGSSIFPIRETHALQPSKGYGDEKVFSERMCMAFSEERKIPMRIVRPTGVYGPGDNQKGAENKDHVPAALARKVIAAKLSGRHEISVWGSGKQTRDFLYVHDFVSGMFKLQSAGLPGVTLVNMGGEDTYSINQIIEILEDLAGIRLARFYQKDSPSGVQHRQLSNAKLWSLLRWLPPTPFPAGMAALYRDLWEQLTIKDSPA